MDCSKKTNMHKSLGVSKSTKLKNYSHLHESLSMNDPSSYHHTSLQKQDTIQTPSKAVNHNQSLKLVQSYNDIWNQKQKKEKNRKMNSQINTQQIGKNSSFYKISDLLGFNSSLISKKQSTIIKQNESFGSEIFEQDTFSGDSLNKFKAQNLELLKINELLLYEKEYYKQKVILQQVQIRELNRKLKDFFENSQFAKCACFKKRTIDVEKENEIKSIKAYNKKLQGMMKERDLNIYKSGEKLTQTAREINIKSTVKKNHSKKRSDQSTFSFQFKSPLKNSNRKKTQPFEQSQEKGKRDEKREQSNKKYQIRNLVRQENSEKSSLLVSQSESERNALKNISNINVNFQIASSNREQKKVQRQFSELLESVQNQSNLQRKLILRKMLAIKAMELKKIKSNF